MSAQEPSGHNSEHIPAETKASTDESQEPPAPAFFPEGSQDQGVFQQKPSVEDPEGIAPRQHSSQPRFHKWRVFGISVVLLLLISSIATGIMLVPRLYRIDTALNSATNQTLLHVKTTEQAIDIPTPTSLPNDLASFGHLNLLLRGLRYRLQIWWWWRIDPDSYGGPYRLRPPSCDDALTASRSLDTQ